MTPFEKRISQATKAFAFALDDRLNHFAMLGAPEDLYYEGQACELGHTLRFLETSKCVWCARNK